MSTAIPDQQADRWLALGVVRRGRADGDDRRSRFLRESTQVSAELQRRYDVMLAKQKKLQARKAEGLSAAPEEGALALRGECRALVLMPEHDAALGEIVERHLEHHPFAGGDADARFFFTRPETYAIVSWPLSRRHAKARVRQNFGDDTVELDQGFLGHSRFLPSPKIKRRDDCEAVPPGGGTLGHSAWRRVAELLPFFRVQFDLELDALRQLVQRAQASGLDPPRRETNTSAAPSSG